MARSQAASQAARLPSGLNGENGLFRSMHDAALRESAAFGSAVHAVFERITRWNGEDKPHWVLHPATEAERTVAACMDVPAIRELFMPAETAIVMKEQRIEAIDGNVWISGVIDRLVIDGNSACIVDFKTTMRTRRNNLGTPRSPAPGLCPHRLQNHPHPL